MTNLYEIINFGVVELRTSYCEYSSSRLEYYSYLHHIGAIAT